MFEYNQVLKHLVIFVPKLGMLFIKSFSIHCIMQLVFLMLIHLIMISPADSPIYLWDNRSLLSHLLGKCSHCLSKDAWTSPSLSINVTKITLYKIATNIYPLSNKKPLTLVPTAYSIYPSVIMRVLTWVWKLSLATMKHNPTYFERNKNQRK